jgi:hypothetical protein
MIDKTLRRVRKSSGFQVMKMLEVRVNQAHLMYSDYRRTAFNPPQPSGFCS